MNPERSATDRPVDRLARSTALDPLADVVQPPLRAWLDGTGGRAWIKDLLHGTSIGHPLHPAVTDVPVGAWTMAAVFDACALAGFERFDAAADLSVAVGIAGGFAASATGWAEWSDTNGEPRRLGLVHALLNGLAVSCYAASLYARLRGRRGAGIGAAFAGYGLVSAAAFLGGELSFNYGIGTKHTGVPVNPPADFTPVLPERELTTAPRVVDLGGIAVLLHRYGDEIRAVAAACTHRGAPLADGSFADGCVTCPWHGARFDLEDGAVLEGPAVYPLARFEARVANGTIELRPFA